MHKSTTPVSNSTKNSQLTPTTSNNDRKADQLKMLQTNIQHVIETMQKEVKENNLLPNHIFNPLFDKLQSLTRIVDPMRSLVCYCVGNTDAGKSSLINALCNSEVCSIGNSFEPGTEDFQTVSVPEVNTSFVDTVGFGANIRDQDLVHTFKAQMQSINHPDVILLVVPRADLRRTNALKNAIDYINTILRWAQKTRCSIEVPVMCVLSKIDEYFPGEKVNSEIHGGKIQELIADALTKINKYLIVNVTKGVAVSSVQNYGIDELILNMNAQSPLNAQIMVKNLEYVKQCRLAMANKIIAAFSTASAAVSFLPVIEEEYPAFRLPFVTILQEWMYRMLACFSIDPQRTPDTFITLHRAESFTRLAVRAVALIVGGVFQLSVVGYLVGTGICVTAASSTTAILGWSCYNYFVHESDEMI